MSYLPPFFLFNAHLETIFPALLRRVILTQYQRERIETPDDDFLDLDWLRNGNPRVAAIISHGLEGSSTRPYVKGMARALHQQGFDIIAWNFRGCSGEINRQRRFYHSGATEDLDLVVRHAIGKGYRTVYLVGFSLGGNLTLKYIGEREVAPEVKRVVAISVPLDLKTSCHKISMPANRIYSNRFLRSLKKKIRQKAALRGDIDVSPLEEIRTLEEFDNCYTAPLHGFKDAVHYYESCSALCYINGINIPTLIINTRNDPFLSEACFPVTQLDNHPYVTLQILSRGGHVGFTQFNKNGLYWSEQRAAEFLTAGESDTLNTEDND